MARTTRSSKRKRDRSSSVAALLPFRGIQHHVDRNKKVNRLPAPSSSWSPDERNAMYLLKKLFDLTIPDCTTILNLLFPGRLARFRDQMIRSQWYGATTRRSSWWRHYMQVMEALTDVELQNICKHHAAEIEAIAISSSIDLVKNSEFQTAQTLPRTRPTDMQLIASHQHQSGSIVKSDNSRMAGVKAINSSPANPVDAGGVLARFTSLTPFVELRLGDTDPQNSLDTTEFVPYKTPLLLYRFYSTESAGLNSSKGIRASRFAMLNKYPVLGAPSVHELLWDTSIHLSRCIMPTSLISTFQSAGVDLAQTFATIYHPAKLVQELKARDMFQPNRVRTSTNGNKIVNTCKYKGDLEYFVYGKVSRRSIIQTISFEDLQNLIAQSTSVRNFLRLKQFMEATNLRALNIALASQKLSLDRNVGIALARIAYLFGLSYRNGPDIMIKFTCQMLRGWCIKITNQLDRIKAVAHTFARVLSSALDTADRSKSSELLAGAFETACKSCMKA